MHYSHKCWSTDRNVSNKYHHKILASRTIRSFLQKKMYAGLLFPSNSLWFCDTIDLPSFKTQFFNFQMSWQHASMLSIEISWSMNNQSINQSSIAGVVTHTVQNKRNNKHDLLPAIVLYRIAREPLHQKNFRWVTVWNEGISFNTDATLIQVGVYALCTRQWRHPPCAAHLTQETRPGFIFQYRKLRCQVGSLSKRG